MNFIRMWFGVAGIFGWVTLTITCGVLAFCPSDLAPSRGLSFTLRVLLGTFAAFSYITLVAAGCWFVTH